MKWSCFATHTALLVTRHIIMTIIVIIITITGEHDGCWTMEVVINQ